MKRVRRRSLDFHNHFNDFTSELKRCSGRLEKIVYELDQVCERSRHWSERVRQTAARAPGIAIAGGWMAGGMVALAPFTGGMSLVALGIAAVPAAALGAVGAVFVSDKETVAQVTKLLIGFLEMVASLKPLLMNMKISLEDLNRDTEAVVRTQTQMQELSSLLKAFIIQEATVERLPEVKEQCSRTLEELKKLKDE